MTSTNDGKDVKSNQTSGQKAKTYYIELYKSLDARLSGECTGEQRTRLVCEAWRRIHSLCQHSAPKTHPHLLTWLQRHTSHTILQTEWQSPKCKDQHSWLEEAIDVCIGECQVTRDAHSWQSQLLHRSKWFKKILSNPWGHPVLKALLDSSGLQPTNDEVLEWLKEEREVMFVTRLRQLAASKCDDLALLLTSAVMTRARDCTTVVSDIDQAAGVTEQSQASKSEPSFVDILREEAGFTVDVWELLTDIEFVLLHKGESRSQCIELAKQTPLRNGHLLVERLKSRLEKSPRDKKLWKNAKDVATLIAQVVIARCMVVPTCNEAARVALYRCTCSLVKLLPVDKLPPAAAALAAPAATSKHLYILANAVHAECKDERKSFVCELFVRAITAGMNELERLKLKTEKESEARSTEETLSLWFNQLGTLLSTSSRLYYECVLTAFSIYPSSSMYKKVEEAPPLAPILKDTQEPKPETNSEFGSWATDSRTQTNLVKTSETLNLKQTQTQANVLSTAIFAEGEALGLGAELCQDLAVLISGPRVKTLSWDMDREILLDSCHKYMERRHGGTRALTTELKYLNLDPRSFQHLPEEVDNENDAFYGIEKGYEHLVEFQEPEEIWQDEVSDDNKKTDSAHSVEELPIVIPRRKKKSKRLKYSDEETDPLSFEENSKRSEKKERPHSKERSKDRKERKHKHKIKEDPNNETEQIKEQGHLINQKIDDIRMKEKKKERKERKKKDKAEKKLSKTNQQKPPQSGPLSRLVGMKVARISDINKQLKKSEPDANVNNNNLCITDSDYDSQGKSSLNSEANDPDVLFDGLFSMDEIKSPEKSIDIIRTPNTIPKLEELRISNGIIVNNSLSVPAMSLHPIQTQNYQLNINPNPRSSAQTNTNNDVSEEVKKSIKKLVEFRINKNSREPSTALDAEILNPKLIPVSNVSLLTKQNPSITKSVKEKEKEKNLNVPEVFLNKKAVNQLNTLNDGVDKNLRNCGNKGNFVDHFTLGSEPQKLITKTNKINFEYAIDKAINRDSVQESSSVRNYKHPVSKNNNPFEEKTPKASLVKSVETPSQIQYKEFLKHRSFRVKTHPQVSNVIDTSSQKQIQSVRDPPKLVSNLRSNLNNANVTTEIVHRDFIKQSTTKKPQKLQTNSEKVNVLDSSLEKPMQSSTKGLKIIPCQSITKVGVPALSPPQNHFESFVRELQESINAGASKEKSDIKLPVSDKTSSPKQVIQQKKVDNAPNTFSRLSYLHKNKQNDGKNKVLVDQNKLSNSSTANKPNLDLNIDKVSHLQSKGEIVISRIDKPKTISKDRTKVVAQKTQNLNYLPSTKNNPLRLNIQYPIISNMLMSDSKSRNSKALTDTENRAILHKNKVTPVEPLPTSTYPSESDKRDLLLLLRQQSKMNPPMKQHKTENPKVIIDNSSTINTTIKSTLKSNINDIRPKGSVVDEIVSNLENSKTLTDISVKVPDNKLTLSEQKKVSSVKVCGKNPKQTEKNNGTSDWESVMNALLAHKTPSRGPNALDIALKKDSFENRYSNNLENQNTKTNHTSTDTRVVTDSANLKKLTTQTNSSVVSSGNIILPNTHTTQPQLKLKQEKKICSKDKNIELGRSSPLDLIEKRFPGIIQNTNDPFISGIPNSDYDLLEELMDDDLRKEIGELMSDEEAYGTLVQTPKSKNVDNDKPVNSFLIKYPNQKLNLMTAEKTETANSCQKLDLVQNKNIIITPKSTIDVPLDCSRLKKPVLQINCNTNTLISNNANKKPRIISNELITSPIMNQPGDLKISNVVQQLKTTVTPKNNNFNENVDINTVSTSSTLPNACIKAKIEDLPIKEVQRTNTGNLLHSKNITLDPTRVILTVPSNSPRNVTPNLMLIGNELICDSFSTVKVDQSNVNTYVPVNQTSNLTLYRTTQFVAPCVNPVVIERSTALPVVQMVTPNMSIISSANTNLKSMNSETEKNLTCAKFHEENKIKTGNFQGNKLKIEVPKHNNKKFENKIDISNTSCGMPENNKNHVCPNSIENSNVLNRDILKAKKLSSKNITLLESIQSNKHNTGLGTKVSTQLSKLNSNFDTNHDITENNKLLEPAKEIEQEIPHEQVKQSLLDLPIPKIKFCQENKKCEKEERDRLQNKRMQIINRQNKQNIYEKPIALSYKSIMSTDDVHNKGKNKDKVLERVIYDNKNVSSACEDHNKNDNEKPNIDIKKKTTSLQKNVDLNICQNFCRKSSDTSINESSINDSSISGNSVVLPSRRISLRSLNDSMALTSPKSIAIKSKVKPKNQSLLKKRLPIQKPTIAKVLKKIPEKSKETNSLKRFGKQIKHKIKIKKSNVMNVETEVSTMKSNIENTDSVSRTIDNVNYTCVDIEEQITSAIIPNIFIEKNNVNKTPEKKLNLTEKNPSSSTDKDAIESNLNGNVQTTTKMMKCLYKEIEKNVEKEKPEINIIDANNTKKFNQPTENKLSTTENHPTSPMDKYAKEANLKGHSQCTSKMIKSLHKEIEKGDEKEKHVIHIMDANNTKTFNQSTENKLSTMENHPTSPMDKDAKEANLKGHAQCATKMIKSLHKEIEKGVEKDKHVIHIINANKNTKTINQSPEKKLNATENHLTSPLDKDTKESNLKGHAQSTTKMIKLHHKEIGKNVMREKHEIHITDANKNTKIINQSAENKLNTMEKHPTSYMDKNTEKPNLRGHVQSTNKMTKSHHMEIEKRVEEEKHEINNIAANKNTNKIYEPSVSKDVIPNKDITSMGTQVKPINVSDKSSKSEISRDFRRTTPEIIQKCNQNSDIQTGLLSNESIDDKLLECKNKVIIEEIPNSNKDPLKKIVRIKLPNGNTFKATISGKLNTNVDSLFEDPAIKSLLWKNIKTNTKCTLNIKQVAVKTASKCQTVVTKVHDISYVHAPVINTETINLISDDEDSVQTFKTEFGNYDIAFMNPDLFLKHQKRLSQKCIVKLERCSTLSKTKKKSKENSTIILCEGVKDINSCTSLQQSSLQEHIADHIEIDDSSNESETTHIRPNTDEKTKLTKTIDDLKHLLLKDLSVEDSTINLKNSFNELAVDSLLQKNITTGSNDEERAKQCPLRMCFVSLVRCDGTLKNLEHNSHLLCNNSKEKSENILNSSEESMSILDGLSDKSSTMKRSGSLSILNDFLVLDESKSIEGCTQIQNHEQICIDTTMFSPQQQNYLDECSADWLMTKYDLHCYYHNNAHKVFGSEFDENLKYDDVSTDYDSDFEIPPSINAPNIKNDNSCVQEQIKYEVPSLNKIIVNYFVNNSNVIEDLRSICQNNDTQPIASSSPLKRKLTGVADDKNRNKILKIENALPQSCDGIHKIPSHNEEVSHEESLSLLEIVKYENSQNNVIFDREKIDEGISYKNNDEEILCLKEIDTIKNSDTRCYDDVNDVNRSGNELSVDLNVSVLNTPTCHLNVSFKKNSSKCFQKEKKTCLTANDLSQTKLSTGKPDELIQCDNESKPRLIYTDNMSEARNFLTECSSDEDKIEVIIPLEKLDDENIQSLPLNSTKFRYNYLSEEPTTDDKSRETKLNRFEGNNLQEIYLNTENSIKKEDITGQNSNSNRKNDLQTINCNKVLNNIDLNKNAEIFCNINNLQKENDQEYSVNKNKDRESDNIVLKNKNKDVFDKELQHKINVEDKDTKTSGDCKPLQNDLITKSSNDALQKNVTLVYKGDSSVVLKGSIYEDPVIGTCYVFPILNKTSYDGEISCSNICDDKTINDIQALKNKVVEDQNDEFEERENTYNFDVIVPKITYSRQRIHDNLLNHNAEKLKRKTLKRKSDTDDNKLNEKRYRKGKNIDYPKITVTAMAESSYSKEYKRLFNYCSSIKFSFSRPFHKECVDVSAVLKCWPIGETTMEISDTTDDQSVLFLDENVMKKGPYDPLQQTLAEEISSKYVEHQLSCDQINESNFSMGFGEGSGRVINLSEDGDNISKFSAATLSDVKQSQPFLLSEDYEENTDKCVEICKFNKDQFDIFKRYVSYIQLRDKVRSFFKKTTLELNYHWLKDNLKNTYKMPIYNKNESNDDFPYDLVNPDFIEPASVEAVVQVVQVGQLPVSAAAQNPVTCDPRVTQVTDASPSQCSVENSPQDDSQSPIKTEYTELTTADLSLPLVQEYERHMKSQESSKVPTCNENIPVEMEVTAEIKHEELPTIKDEPNDYNDNDDLQSLVNKHINNVEYSYNSNAHNSSLEAQSNNDMIFETLEKHNVEVIAQKKQHNGSAEKTDQIAHAMNAAGITTTSEINSNQRGLINIMSPKMGSDVTNQVPPTNNYSKPAINAISLQQALAQILPPPLNQTNSQDNNQTGANSSATSQVLHIVQGKNTNGSQLTLVDNTQNSVINNSNTPVLHIVQNKGVNTNSTSNANAGQHTATYGGLSLVETGLQQGNNQLLHIVNTGNQKNSATGQLLKRVNLLTNLSNVQGTNDQKMVQFLCKAADGKSIQLNASHQRSMVLRLQPIESSNIQVNQKSDSQDLSPSGNTNITQSNKESVNAQHEIKSRSVYEENYAKFIQSSTNKCLPEKSTSLPKFNQAFGKQVFQDGNQKSNDINSDTTHLSSVNLNTESTECQSSDAALNLDHIGQISSPPLLLRKTTPQTTQVPSAQPNLMQQIKQTISPMNIQTMHGGVIYTRQIPVNIGGGQTINLITVPSTELIEENNQKQPSDVKYVNQNEIDSPIIKMVPQNQTSNTDSNSDENLSHVPPPNENSQNTPSQHQPVLTQMRIKLPMLSKAPQMVSGTRLVRPSFFQIQRNVIGGANQPVYQQLVLTAAPSLGQHTIRLPQTQTTRQVKVNSESQSSTESQMSSSTLEQLREFDMVLEQVKERSTVQPNSNVNNTYTKLSTPTSEATETTSITSTVTESTQQVLYSIGSNQSVNVAYVNRKPNATTPTQSGFARSPDSSGIIESPSSSTHVQIPHTVTSETSSSEGTTQQNQQKAAKVGSKSKSRPKSSHPPNSLKINTVPPKTSTQKPLEDEQTTQRILYILAEYKEQVENSPDKDKPAPRRRSNPPTNPSGSSKRKKSSSSSRRPGGRDMSPVHGDETCRTMGSEDSSCGTSQGDCTENCLETHSPQDSPRKVVRKLSFENETNRSRPQPQRNVIVADGQTITVARGTAGKPTTAVLMPANYILPVSMVKGGQQIAIVTNRGPKLLTVGGGESGATNALLLQRLIGPAGLKPVLARPGVRHVRLPTAALHNLQAFNLATATTVHPPDSTASPAPAPTPPELIDTRAASSPWTDRESQDIKPERGSSPEDSEPWNLPSSADPHDYTYEETVRTDNMDRTVLDAIPDRYSPEMEAQRIFDKMFDVDSKRSYIVDSQDDTSRCAYDIDASDSDDKAYHQVVQRKDGSSHRQHRLTHVSAAALRHKYAILEHELRLQGTAFLQKSLSEECEDLGVDSPSASELFPEAELLFAASPAHDAPQHSHTPQPTVLNQSGIPQPDIDDQIATDRLLHHDVTDDQQDLGVTLGLDEGIVTVSEDGMQATIALDQEEFARSHPNTTFHSEPTDEGEVQPFTITGLKGRHITSTIFHAGRAPATVLVTTPQTTVISQATPDNAHNNVKFANINQIINSSPVTHGNLNLSSVLVKDDRLTKFDSILTDSRELHLSHTASAIVHSTGNATQVIRRVCYEDDKRDTRFLMDEPEALIAGDDAKMIADDSSRDATLESMAGEIDDDNSSPERHAELFWESNSASERSESRRPLDFSSDSEKCCKSPSYDETNSTDSSGVGTHMRLDSVIKDARGIERSGSAEGSSADDTQPPLRTYPAKRMYHTIDREMERSMSGKTRAGFQEERSESLEVRRRASNRGVVKRGCHCCNGSPAPSRPKKSRQRKPTIDFTSN